MLEAQVQQEEEIEVEVVQEVHDLTELQEEASTRSGSRLSLPSIKTEQGELFIQTITCK